MMKKCFCIGMIMLVSLMFIAGSGMGADFKAAELQRKAEEIASLRVSIAEKVSHAEDMRRQLADQMNAYVKEIRHEKNRWQLNSYRNAVGNPRIA